MVQAFLLFICEENVGEWRGEFIFFIENTCLCGSENISGVFLGENSDLFKFCIFQVLYFLFVNVLIFFKFCVFFVF